MERDISFSFLFKILKKTWWKIAIIALVVMILVASFTHFFVPKQYSSSIEFYVVNIDAKTDYASTQMLSAATQLINDYVDIITSEYMLSIVAEKMTDINGRHYENVTVPMLENMIQASTKTDSSVFTLTVVHTDPHVAYDVACVIANEAPEAVTAIAKPDSYTFQGVGRNIYSFIKYYNDYMVKEGEPKVDVDLSTIVDTLEQADSTSGLTSRLLCMDVLTTPKMATTHHSPNLLTSTLLGGTVAVFAAYIFFLIFALLEQSITTEDDLKKMIGRPVIGMIPHWETASKK